MNIKIFFFLSLSATNLFGAQFLTKINPMLTTLEQLAASEAGIKLVKAVAQHGSHFYGVALGNRSYAPIYLAALIDSGNMCPEFPRILSGLPNNHYVPENHQHLVTMAVPPRHFGVLGFLAGQTVTPVTRKIILSTNLTSPVTEYYCPTERLPVAFSDMTFYE